MNTPNQLPDEPKIGLVVKGKKLRAITNRQSLQLMQWEMDYRFVREVEHLEREGRVSSRADLEAAIGLSGQEVAAIRLGNRGVGLVNVALLFSKYRGDRDYIMYGQRNKELAAPYIAGVGRIDRYDPYYYRYPSPARWRVGARPETHAQYYPQDPDNKQWVAPARLSIASFSDKSGGKEEEKDE